ncbi:MAG TPA: halocarboxylic acid dehydrogenase DehI family protein [Terriglobales bacterium]|nr:halocarboxylic acid dehydrogenase DehI family protein [Terriglobales bacterium]
MPWRKGHKLKLVPENQAQGRVREIFEEVKRTLGIPYLDDFYQALGAYPAFLEMHWKAVRPIAQSQQFFALAARLRADAYTRMHSYFEIPDLCARITDMQFSPGAREELTGVVELSHYSDPLMLLLVAAQFQAFESPFGQDELPRVPASHPVFSERPCLIEEDTATPRVKKIYDEVKRAMDLPFTPLVFRATGRWPDFLTVYWETLRTILRSPVYEGCHYGVRESAFALTREFPSVIDLTLPQLTDAGIDDEQLASVVRICDLFVDALGSTVLNVSLAKIALEGGTRAGAEPHKRVPQPATAGKGDQAA